MGKDLPWGEMHVGGLPQLSLLTPDQAAAPMLTLPLGGYAPAGLPPPSPPLPG
jgi:hypothetical protein